MVAGVGVAGAAEEQAANVDVYARDAGGPCWSETPSAPACAPGERADVEIETGDTVTWHFAGGQNLPHNAAAEDGTWKVPEDGSFPNSGSDFRTFNQPGTFEFVCQVHAGTMTGTITVTGDPIETPTPTPTSTSTPTPTPTPTVTPTATPTTPPGGGGGGGGAGHVITPPPTGGAGGDTVKPAMTGVSVKALRRAARVRFTVSEPASVTVRIKRGRKTIKTARVHAPRGTRTVTLRSRRLKKGRYLVQLSARDAVGNVSALTTKRLRVRR